MDEFEAEVSKLQIEHKLVIKEISKAVIGYEDIITDFVICMISGGHILMEGVPGIAKTTLAKAFSNIVGLDYSRVQFTQDLLPSDIIGHYYYAQQESRFEVRKGPLFAQLILADEINRAPPKTQSALLEAMEEKQVTIEGNTFPLPDTFMVIATINPIEAEGVYPLPEAQLDRFMFKSKMDYLEPDDEMIMLKKKNKGSLKMGSLKKVDPALISRMTKAAKKVHISDELLGYIRDLILATREQRTLVLGASPRAGEQMIYASKAAALLNGRTFVLPDDIKVVARKVFNHRLILSVDAEIEGLGVDAVIEQLLQSVAVPKGRAKKRNK